MAFLLTRLENRPPSLIGSRDNAVWRKSGLPLSKKTGVF
jgi:hypothetical protein